jgi:hypothetical protein
MVEMVGVKNENPSMRLIPHGAKIILSMVGVVQHDKDGDVQLTKKGDDLLKQVPEMSASELVSKMMARVTEFVEKHPIGNTQPDAGKANEKTLSNENLGMMAVPAAPKASPPNLVDGPSAGRKK